MNAKSAEMILSLVAMVMAVGLVMSGCSTYSPGENSKTEGEDSKSEGTLTVAVPGSANDSLDPHSNPGTSIETLRSDQLFDNLTDLNENAELGFELAESITPNDSADVWTIKLRKDVTFHDGTSLDAADVKFTLERILAPDSTANGKTLIDFINLDKVKEVDKHTIRISLDKPYGAFPEVWTNRYLRIVPTGFDPQKPIGTGPFMYESFVPGRSSVFTANPDYWRGAPKLDAVKIMNFADNDAAANAFRGGQVDVAYSVPLSQIQALRETPGVRILDSPADSFMNFAMNVKEEPFNDERVREAMRLTVDRQQLVDNALSGYGEVGNDWVGRYSSCGLPDVPQREQDIERARKLLSEAGQSDLEVDLVASNGTAGMTESAQIFAEQAREAGITVHVVSLDFGAFMNQFLEWDFSVDWWTDNYMGVVDRTLVPGAFGNETHWENERFLRLREQAQATPDADARCEVERQMRKIEHEDGGNIVWGFANVINAYTEDVHGLKEDATGKPMRQLEEVWKTS